MAISNELKRVTKYYHGTSLFYSDDNNWKQYSLKDTTAEYQGNILYCFDEANHYLYLSFSGKLNSDSIMSNSPIIDLSSLIDTVNEPKGYLLFPTVNPNQTGAWGASSTTIEPNGAKLNCGNMSYTGSQIAGVASWGDIDPNYIRVKYGRKLI